MHHENSKKIYSDYLIHKTYFKKKSIIRVGKEHFVKIKETIHQEDTTILNVYTSNNSVLNYMKPILLQGETNPMRV